jgi:DNA-binding response OmpR family regulator
MTNILLLEDDKLFSLSLIDYLEEFSDMKITHASNSIKMLELIYENRYDLYLLDINLPDINGLDLLKDIRGSTDETPAIFLTSYKDKETLAKGFLNGADDFLTKPFDMDELILRINCLMKRVKKKSIITLANLEFNFDTKEVKKDGKNLKFSLKSLELFELFHQNNHAIVTKEMIINKLWSVSETYSDGSIRVYVNNIKKLFCDDSTFKISNIKNIGYKIEY